MYIVQKELQDFYTKIFQKIFLARCIILIIPVSYTHLGVVPPELMGNFSIIFYQSAEDAVFKALGVE